MKKPRNLHGADYRIGIPTLFAVSLALIAVSYGYYSSRDELIPHTVFGITCGVLGFISILFLYLYWARKNAIAYGPMHQWFLAHVYVAIIAIFLIFIHSGFRVAGIFSGILLGLFILVSMSGILGTVLYYAVPLSLSKYGSGMLSLGDIDASYKKFLEDSDKVAEGASERFKSVYNSRIRPYMLPNSTPWQYFMLEENKVINQCQQKFKKLKGLVPPTEAYDLQIIGGICMQRDRLAFKSAKLNILKAWQDFHIPVTVVFGVAVVIHLVSMAYF